MRCWCFVLAVLSFPVLAWQPAGDPQADQYFSLNGELAASHILITYKGADKADPSVKRSRKEARALANEVHAKVIADPSKFEDLAREYSDGPTGPRGGDLGAFNGREMAGPFDKALKKLTIGDIAPAPVRTGFGFHIIRRNDLMVKNYTARQVLMVHSEANVIRGVENKAAYQRSREEAMEALRKLRPSLTADNFAEMSDKHSDLRGKGGFMGVLKSGISPVSEATIQPLESMAYGEISDIVELPIGYALLLREKVVQIKASQILIAYAGAEGAKDDVTRSKDAAQAEAERIAALIKADSTRFNQLAKDHSDDLFAVRGGLLPAWFRGYQPREMEVAVLAMEIGETSATVVESPKGFHLLRREKL